jgi:hypothetical protein
MALTQYCVCAIFSSVSWELEFEDAFGEWWDRLTADEQEAVDFIVQLLAAHGPSIGSPMEPSATESHHAPTREIHVPDRGRTYRIQYTFEPGRSTIVLLVGTTFDYWWSMSGALSVKGSALDVYGR